MFRRKDEGAPDAATDAPTSTTPYSPASEVQIPPAAQGQSEVSAPSFGTAPAPAPSSNAYSTSSPTSTPSAGSASPAPAPASIMTGGAYASPYRASGASSAPAGSASSNVTELSGRSSATGSRFGETRSNTGNSPMDKSANKPAGKNRILTVGNDILMKGEINSCDRIVIEGAVDATLKEVHTMEIAESGSFKGVAEVEEAEISGTVEGDLTVRGRLIIYSTGKVSGKVSYGEIEIERGGQLTGEIKTAGIASSSMNKAAA